jgi:hypothetical protein
MIEKQAKSLSQEADVEVENLVEVEEELSKLRLEFANANKLQAEVDQLQDQIGAAINQN